MISFNRELWKHDAGRLSIQLPEILVRLQQFKDVPYNQWGREILICLLTPQTTPQKAELCLQALERNGLFEKKLCFDDVARILRKSENYIRFHNVKANRILILLEQLDEILQFITRQSDPRCEREFLVQNIKGFGLKEASHALRNIGRENLAILDRHILKNLLRLEVIDQVPSSLNKRRYFEIEERFLQFAEMTGYTIDILDLFFWSRETGSIFK